MSNAPIVELKVKKPNIFKRIKHWWKEELTEDDRDIFKIAGIWFVDGIMLGSMVTGASCMKKSKKASNVAAAAGYISGQMDAYKEMAQNQYTPMTNSGMKNFNNNNMKKF